MTMPHFRNIDSHRPTEPTNTPPNLPQENQQININGRRYAMSFLKTGLLTAAVAALIVGANIAFFGPKTPLPEGENISDQNLVSPLLMTFVTCTGAAVIIAGCVGTTLRYAYPAPRPASAPQTDAA